MIRREVGALAGSRDDKGLGLWGNLFLHSQFILIGLLILGAVILKTVYR